MLKWYYKLFDKYIWNGVTTIAIIAFLVVWAWLAGNKQEPVLLAWSDIEKIIEVDWLYYKLIE